MSSTQAPAPQSQGSNNSGNNDKAIVKDYFNSAGFDRWRRIYGEGDDINKVQRDIRIGHQRTIDLVLYWFKVDQNLEGRTICDAGCGVGSLSLPLAAQGATVDASDISEKMVGEAIARAKDSGIGDNLKLEAKDLEAIEGSYDSVICLDVLIHYPDAEMEAMLTHLASRAKEQLILSFAPKNGFYTLLKRIGEFFPGPSKATRAYLHREKEVITILKKLGWELNRSEFTATQFYFSRLMEFVKPEVA